MSKEHKPYGHHQASAEMAAFPCPPNPVWKDVAPAFSAGDVECMLRISKSQGWPVILDLTNYASVYANKDAINGAVNSGQMPMNPNEQPWAPLACWNVWYGNGCPET
jgi:hypothetical protein